MVDIITSISSSASSSSSTLQQSFPSMEGQREADSTMTEESWETIGLDHQRNSVLPSVSMSVSM
eukprot:CAMPEP_0198279944 /NCGR_PEP_ID=MMETSP1449-20131203/145_1 /TAXON_ID=420275 /ORGANISM="Attheya septentrionalis, Strain CCMP2084" /LENGTH=63 /DNA_ID=CAMNT_0043975195 /DNA_START=84 /DNA_END=272 /DNA_ORIENTATION=-